jgi:hypothetical protein
MSQHSVEQIREILEKEIPKLRTGDAFGVLFGLAFSLFLLSGIGVVLAFVIFPNPGPAALLGIPLLVLALSYVVGAALDGSETMVGADIANTSAQDYNSSWTGYGRDHAATGMQVGLALMFLQMLTSAVYGTVKYLRERGSVSDTNTSRIAAVFVYKVLNSGPTKQDALFAIPAIEACSVEEKRAALAALTSSDFVQSLPTGVQMAPQKRYLF